MKRPALSAMRSLDVMELLATFPHRNFTLGEIVKATGINIASCHAILNTLVDKGYLARVKGQKRYHLGLSLVAMGQAAQMTQPIVGRAMRAAEQLHTDLGLPVLLSTIVGDEILAVMSLQDRPDDVLMQVGERLPLVAPIGVPFLAWAPEDEVTRWITRRTTPMSQELLDVLRDDLQLTRERGFQVVLRPPERHTIGSRIAEMANGDGISNYRAELSEVIHQVDQRMCAPVKFVADETYDILMIACPIFDQSGSAIFNISLGSFPRELSGAALLDYADRLSNACLEVMRWTRQEAKRKGQGLT